MWRVKLRTKGVTLIELVVVMALLTFVAALVTPAFSRGLDNLALRSTGKRLATMFRRAQVEARVNQTAIWAVYEERKFVFYRGQTVLQSFELPAGINVVQRATAEAPRLVFNILPSGQMVGPPVVSLSNARGREGTLRLGGIIDSVEFVETSQ